MKISGTSAIAVGNQHQKGKMRSCAIPFRSAVCAALLVSVCSVKAEVITQQFSVTDDNNGFDTATSVWFNPFNASIGTLLDVNFIIDGSWRGEATFKNPFTFPVVAHVAGRAYSSFGPWPYLREPLLEFIHPVTIELTPVSETTLRASQSVPVQWQVPFDGVKDHFVGTSPLEYRLLVEHSQSEGRFFDLNGQQLCKAPGDCNFGPDSARYEVTQTVTVEYRYCPLGQDCYVSSVPEPQTYAMLVAGLGLLGLTARRRRQKLNA